MAKKKVMYCVMVNDALYGDSLSPTKDGAASYLGDARHAAEKYREQTGKKPRVYLARVELTKVRPPVWSD